MISQFVGLAASALTAFSFVPQVVKMYKSKHARDVSLATLIQLSSGVTLWMVYGVMIRDRIIILANAVTLVSLAAALTLFFVYNARK